MHKDIENWVSEKGYLYSVITECFCASLFNYKKKELWSNPYNVCLKPCMLEYRLYEKDKHIIKVYCPICREDPNISNEDIINKFKNINLL